MSQQDLVRAIQRDDFAGVRNLTNLGVKLYEKECLRTSGELQLDNSNAVGLATSEQMIRLLMGLGHDIGVYRSMRLNEMLYNFYLSVKEEITPETSYPAKLEQVFKRF